VQIAHFIIIADSKIGRHKVMWRKEEKITLSTGVEKKFITIFSVDKT
jgi:hypothetical protein